MRRPVGPPTLNKSYVEECGEVGDSVSWRRFWRIPLDEAVPHPTTLMKITSRCGTDAVDGLNEALLAKPDGFNVIRLDKVRAGTTVVEADVAYPTDAGLLAKAAGTGTTPDPRDAASPATGSFGNRI